MIIVLDSGVLGSITNPKAKSGDVKAMTVWAAQMRMAGHTFAIPAIADYETRPELLRGGSLQSITAHSFFCHEAGNLHLSISDTTLEHAAALWAEARNMGKPIAGNDALDEDVILCAQVLEAGFANGGYIVATTNTKHLLLFVVAAEWQNVAP